MPISAKPLSESINAFWDEAILPTLCQYIRIPCLSVDFDPQWAAHGHMEAARRLALDWLAAHPVPGWRIHDQTLPGRTPLILIEIPGDTDQTILIYGHLDKQPEMEGWEAGLGPWKPVIRDGRLYGRGGADDGYALFAAVAAVRTLKAQGLPHARLVILIEFSEESGSPDLPPYLETYEGIIGSPDLVIALDSGAGDYQRLWSTTSLRGMLSCTLGVRVLREATHSGMASGIIPSSMRIMRRLLERLEDPATGEIRPSALHARIPEQRRRQAEAAAKVLGDGILDAFNTVPGLEPVSDDPVELLLNNTWRPTLCVVGQEGVPDLRVAGNVLRAYTRLKLSLRLPPGVDWEGARDLLRETLTTDPPYRAQIELGFDQGGNGWDAAALAPWLETATGEASRHFFARDAAYFGLGGSIPFMAMLGERYPAAQFLITGVLGPRSNAHGPNEFLHIPYAKRLTASAAYIIARHLELSRERPIG
jgi:acetylornithine deacetylase/succinyl-diaminopimelate desuccinylase-like protein